MEKIEEGYDLVNGWRAVRHDHADKTLPSKIANTILWKGLLKTSLHDMNCGFKAFRKEVLEEFSFYGDNYRFIPFMAEQKVLKVAEVKVQHRSRVHGKSKYGMWRVFLALLIHSRNISLFDIPKSHFIFLEHLVHSLPL